MCFASSREERLQKRSVTMYHNQKQQQQEQQQPTTAPYLQRVQLPGAVADYFVNLARGVRPRVGERDTGGGGVSDGHCRMSQMMLFFQWKGDYYNSSVFLPRKPWPCDEVSRLFPPWVQVARFQRNVLVGAGVLGSTEM